MRPSYTKVGTPGGPAFVKASAADAIAAVDSIVFDCDGVLIDTRRSYDATIVATVDRLVRRMFGVSLPWKSVANPLIQDLRNTGGFNNDWDTVYAIIIFTACSLPPRYSSGFDHSQPRAVGMQRAEAERILARVVSTVRAFGRKMSGSGRDSVDEFILRSFSEGRRELCGMARRFVGYPGNPPSSLLASLFDEMYHGKRLYKEMYGAEPRYYTGRGFIQDDEVIVRRSELSSLSRAVGGRLALSTGRPRQAAEYSLGNLISFFRPEASVFIGDADVRPTSEANSFRKPSGKSLLLAKEKLKSRQLAYVGDSAEDWQMVVNARSSSNGIAFVGVYAMSYDPVGQLRFFKREGAELIVPTVRQLLEVIREAVSR